MALGNERQRRLHVTSAPRRDRLSSAALVSYGSNPKRLEDFSWMIITLAQADKP